MIKRIVLGLETLALVAAIVFVVMLFANEPSGGAAGASGAAESPGATLFRANCASCHGADGSGGIGPKLAGRVVSRFPNVDDQIAVVTKGRGGMPSFAGTLSTDAIRQVVDYTRNGLGTKSGSGY